ncbi:MAG: Gfo/Idh/MocA family protein [Myxococcota bacterium]
MIQFGLIGLGAHGARYAAHLEKDVPGARLAAVCRRNREAGGAWARAHGVRFYPDYEALLDDREIDAVAVVTTPDVQGDIAAAGARRGKHLILEKPLSVDAAAGERLVRAVSGRGVTVMVAQTLRWNAVVETLRAHLSEIGPLHTIRLSQRMEGQAHPWQRDRAVAGGGNILHTGIHLFDLVRFFTGEEVEQVTCEMRSVENPGVEDAFAAVMRLAGSGTLVLVDSSKATRSRSARLELVGERGQLVGDHVHGYARRIAGNAKTDLAPPPPVFTVKEALRAFVACLARSQAPPVTPVDGLRAVEIADACYRSAQAGRPEPVNRASLEEVF